MATGQFGSGIHSPITMLAGKQGVHAHHKFHTFINLKVVDRF